MRQSSSEAFLRIPYDLLQCPKLTLEQKLIISYIRGFQDKNLQCSASNNNLVLKLNIGEKTVERSITALNKLPFFKSVKTSNFNEHGKWRNSKLMTVDESMLKDFLDNKNMEAAVTEVKNPIPVPSSQLDQQSGFILDELFNKYVKLYRKYPTLLIEKIKTNLIGNNSSDHLSSQVEDFVDNKLKNK